MEKSNKHSFNHYLNILHTLSEIIIHTSTEPDVKDDKDAGIDQNRLHKVFNRCLIDVDEAYQREEAENNADQSKIPFEEKKDETEVKDKTVVEKADTVNIVDAEKAMQNAEAMKAQIEKEIQDALNAEEAVDEATVVENAEKKAIKLVEEAAAKAAKDAEIAKTEQEDDKDRVLDAPPATNTKVNPSIDVVGIMNLIKDAIQKGNRGVLELKDKEGIKKKIREQAKEVSPVHELVKKDKALNKFFGHLEQEVREEIKKEKLATTPKTTTAPPPPPAAKIPTPPVKKEEGTVEKPVIPTPPVAKEVDTSAVEKILADANNVSEEATVDAIEDAVEKGTPVVKDEANPVVVDAEGATATENDSNAENDDANKNIVENTTTVGVTLEDATKALEACKNFEEITSTSSRIFVDLFNKKRHETIGGVDIKFHKFIFDAFRKIKADTVDETGQSKIIPKSNGVLKSQIHRWEADWIK